MRPAVKRRLLTLAAALLLTFYGCGPEPATVGPTTTQMVGSYATTDSRAAATTLDLRADGTFTLANWPGINGSGTWTITENDVTKAWQLTLAFATPRVFFVSGNEVLGGPGNYSLGFFIDDPDEGAVILERRRR
jgi:hypothetical protein